MQEYKCPCCGGAINFDSSTQKMKCPYCDSEFEIDTIKAYTDEKQAQEPSDMNWNNDISTWGDADTANLAVYSCNSCGGQIVTDSTTASTTCPFCDNPVVMTGKVSGELKPDFVIPFKLDKNRAKEGFKQHLSGKFFLPKVFKTENHIDEIKGIYVPFWLFNADAVADIHYKATKVHHHSDSKYNYTRTDHFLITRKGTLDFEKVPVDGSQKMPDDLMESIEPFDYREMVPFESAYLAGYAADKYDVDDKTSIKRANDRITQSTIDAFRNTVTGYATVTNESTNIQLKNNTVKYALLPVWILNTTWRNQKFIFAMNGQTGKFVGNLPADTGKAAGLFLSVSAISTLIIYLITMFF